MNFDIIPSPRINFQKVKLSTSVIQGIEAERLTLSPSIVSLLTLKPGASVFLNGFFDGSAMLGFTSSLPTDDGQDISLNININSINIGELTSLLKLPANISGKMSLNAKGNTITTMDRQPTFNIGLKLNSTQLTSISIPTQIGPLAIPNITLNALSSQIRLDKGKLQISSLKIDNRSSIYGNVTGTVDLEFKSGRRGISPQMGVYDLRFNLGLTPALEQEMKIYLDALGLSKYKKGGIYQFIANGTPYGIPSIRGM